MAIQHTSSFAIDDAFSDGDDLDLSYKLSRTTIRDDLARNLPPEDTTWPSALDTAKADNFFEAGAPNESVSTLDIAGRPRTASLSLSERSPSPDDDTSGSPITSDFSQIALDENVDLHAEDSIQESSTESSAEKPYPSVVIDASETSANGASSPHNSSSSFQYYSSPYYNADTAHSSNIQSTRSLSAVDSITTTTSQPFASSQETPASASASSSISSPNATTNFSSTGSSSTPQKPPSRHRPTRSTGPSAFEKVRSKTRPSFLPPKPRQEDDKHMADWQAMMKLSRAAADKRRKALQERRYMREAAIEASLHRWEKEIVPDWKVVHRNPNLRKLWWKGIPTKLRAVMWERAVGNALALSKDHYRTCSARAKRALNAGTFPQATLALIERDIETTLPALHIFHRETGPLYSELKDMLCAWVVSRSDEGLGYTPGAGRIAAMLLLNMPIAQGFVVMRNLLERHCMRSFFGGERAKEDVDAYYRIFDTLLADGMPKIYFNFKQHQISPAAYLPDWLLSLFLDHLPFEACARVWDVLLLEGDSFLYRAALGILAVLEPRLFFPDRKELLELLSGENKPAMEVARREGRALDGGKYEIYGLDEETLWERIDGMEEWWKETTWTRLIQRELPDL